jgi:dienelactone hydrolase
MPRLALVLLLAALTAAGCGGDSPTSPSPAPAPPAPAPTGSTAELTISGDPESAAGATWTLRGEVDGGPVDLQGILLKPQGSGPFPAVVLSHGNGGRAATFGPNVGREMRAWGLVCVATNYTHAAGVPLGAPGNATEPGASPANVARAHATLTVLARLGYVDVRRVAAHGHSMGAFVTTAFAAAYPGEIRAASHTSGGARPDAIAIVGAAPSDAVVASMRTPYQWHHGADDRVVPLAMDQLLDLALGRSSAPHEGHVYPGEDHDIAAHREVLERVRRWYAAHGIL